MILRALFLAYLAILANSSTHELYGREGLGGGGMIA